MRAFVRIGGGSSSSTAASKQRKLALTSAAPCCSLLPFAALLCFLPPLHQRLAAFYRLFRAPATTAGQERRLRPPNRAGSLTPARVRVRGGAGVKLEDLPTFPWEEDKNATKEKENKQEAPKNT